MIIEGNDREEVQEQLIVDDAGIPMPIGQLPRFKYFLGRATFLPKPLCPPLANLEIASISELP